MVVLGGWAFSYGRGTPMLIRLQVRKLASTCNTSNGIDIPDDGVTFDNHGGTHVQGYLAHEKTPSPMTLQ
jgi:hypothetical protein